MDDRALLELDGPGLLEIKLALRSAGLPADDIRPEITSFYRLEDGDGPLGWAAIERHGDQGLLRSVLVLDHRRREGAGTDLIRRVVAAARATGVGRLWLLTETAAPFFEKLGFYRSDRADAPQAIRGTSEFRNVCPASATCMMLDLQP